MHDWLLDPVSKLIIPKGQLNSEFIVFSEIPAKNYRDFCPGSLLEDRAEISVIFGRFLEETTTSKIHSEFNCPLEVCSM